MGKAPIRPLNTTQKYVFRRRAQHAQASVAGLSPRNLQPGRQSSSAVAQKHSTSHALKLPLRDGSPQPRNGNLLHKNNYSSTRSPAIAHTLTGKTSLSGGDGKSNTPGLVPPTDTRDFAGDRGSTPSILGRQNTDIRFDTES